MLSKRKSIVKKSISCLMSAVLLLCAFSILSTSAYADTPLKEESRFFAENENLSAVQIDARFKKIYSNYDVGEPFAATDTDFVKRYATSAQGNKLQSSHGFDVTQSNYGTTVRFSGSVYHSGAFSYTYGGNVGATKVAGVTPSSMRVTIQCVSFGVVGSNGWGIIYSGEFGHAVNYSNSIYLNGSRSYLGVMVVYQLTPYCVVNTSNGSFTL